ncbi:ZIP family metal transporter [Candidatus Woesearchaeota archaeon]|nr:ZIP family metal transporter [Candidatus Woesearchaeota archaeon]
MVQELLYTLVSVLIVSAISLIGISAFLVSALRLEKVLHFIVSFSAGALLGDALLHLIPEVADDGMTTQTSLAILFGIIVFFVLEKFLHWHHCHLHEKECKHGGVKPYVYLNLIADGMHNFIDGLVIGASYIVSIPVGVATTTAVVFHEIPQEIGDFAILIKGGFSKSKALLYNFFSAATAILGGLLAFLLATPKFVDLILPLTAGGFIYVALADLIPELHKEPTLGRSVHHLLGLLLGIMVMILLLMLE